MTIVRLPRLPYNWNDQPELFRRYWDEAMSSIEDTLNAILAIPEIAAAVEAAQTAADEARDAADDAQAAADSVTEDTSIQSSWVEGLTLESENLGATCRVAISAHTRKYGDGTDVSVNSGLITGLAHETIVRVYYDDPTIAGGAVTYQWTSDVSVAAQIGSIHSVGAVVTQRAAEMGDITGSGLQPPGAIIP